MKPGSAAEVWEAALGELQLEVSKPNYETWLKGTVGLDQTAEQFVVGVPNSFAIEWLEQIAHPLVRKILIKVTGKDLDIVFEVHQKSDEGVSNVKPAAAPYALPADPASRSRVARPRLNSRYTFDSFIVGSSNRLAHAAALGVAENPGASYNPLFIYGGTGLGKTHLLHAIGWVAWNRNLSVLYVSTEQFTNEFINAIRERKTDDFRNKYRGVDVLLIDDIHFISGKEQTQEGFFHTFNDLHNNSRQIVISSDRPPKAMPLLEDRLRSRFEWGLIADIQPPDLETRLAILHTKAEQQSTNMPNDVLDFIAHRAQKSIRELEGSLNRVVALCKLTRNSPTVTLAEQALADVQSNSQRRSQPTPHVIIEKVARYYSLEPEVLKGKDRNKKVAMARHVAMYLMREEAQARLAEIGREMGNRDHKTVSYGCERIAAEVNSDVQLRREVLDIKESLYPQAGVAS